MAPQFLREKLRGRYVLQKTIGSTGWLVLDRLVRLGVGLVVNVWVARYLGPANFGLLNFAIAFVALFSIFSNLGLQGVIVRDLVTHPGEREALLGGALFLRLIGSVLAVVCAVAVVYFLRPGNGQSREVVAILALALVPQAWDVIDYDYQAQINSRPIVIIRNLSFLVCSAAKAILIVAGGSVVGFAWITAAETGLSAALMINLARVKKELPRMAKTTSAQLRHLLRTCWPLVVTGLSVLLYWRIDQVMLGQIIGDAGVGVFSAAVRVSEVWYFIPLAISSSVAPAMTAIYQRSKSEYLRTLLAAMQYQVWLGVAIALIFTIWGAPLIHALFGPGYVQAGAILAIHGWAGIFVAVGVFASGWFVNRGLLRYSMYQTFAGAVCNISLNLILIPRFGGIGAAIATVVSQMVSTVLLNAVFRECRELFRIQILSWVPGYRLPAP